MMNIYKLEKKSILTILCNIIYSTAVGSFIGYLVITFYTFPINLFFAPFAVVIGTLWLALPLIPVAFVIAVYLDRKKLATKRNIIVSAILVSSFFGLFLYFYSDPQIIYLASYPIGAFFASWSYWRMTYENIKGFRIF